MEKIPILRMGEYLLVTIQVDMHDRLACTLQEDLTNRISETGAHGVLIDISSLEIVDSFIGRMLGNIAAMSRILDAQTVVVGMQPAVAITLVELGMSLPGVRTALNVDAGMDVLRESLNGQKGDESCQWSIADTIPVAFEADVVVVRRRVREVANKVGLSLVDQTKLVTAASELARNTVMYGGGGSLQLESLNGPRLGVRLIFVDHGPGIPDLEFAMRDGFTTGTGLGPRIGRREALGQRI